MSKEKLTMSEITDLISAQAKISKKNADDFLKLFFETIEEDLLAGNQVKIKGFGTFKLQWNEPRKSVNVQTGEEIILAGYNKVVFAPDTSLKEAVNEPFAHLETIILDGNEESASTDNSSSSVDEVTDPLRIFNEQASEIMGILSEIQSMNPVLEDHNKQTVAQEEYSEIVIESTSDPIPDFEPEIVQPEFDLVEPEDIESSIQEEAVRNSLQLTEESTETTSPISEDKGSVEEPTPKAKDAQEQPELRLNDVTGRTLKDRKKKRKKIAWIISITLLLAFASSASYMYFYPPAFCWCKYKVITTENLNKIKDKAVAVVDWVIVQKTKIFGKEPVKPQAVVPNNNMSDAFSEPDSVNVPEPVDSLALLFNQRRSYTEFIASVRVHDGSRLTYLSNQYYGNKEFWVYIYEANKEKIKDPDHLRPGTLIKVPKVDKKLINPDNPRCIDYARELHDLYVKKKH